jgi:hypothetical protein
MSKARALYLTIVAIEAARAEALRQVDMYLEAQRFAALSQYDAEMQYLDQMMHAGNFDAGTSFVAEPGSPTDKFKS